MIITKYLDPVRRGQVSPVPLQSALGLQYWKILRPDDLDLAPITNKDEQLNAYSGWVYCAVRMIQQDIRAAKWDILQVEQGKRQDEWQAVDWRADRLKYPGLAVFGRPNALQTWGELIELTQAHKDITGEAFWRVVTRGENGKGALDFLEQIYPQWVDEPWIEGGVWKGWRITIPGYTTKNYTAAEIIFHRYQHPSEVLCGMSPVEAMALSHDIDRYSLAYGAALLKNLGQPVGILSSDQQLTEQQAQLISERWKDKHTNKPGEIAVLDKGAKYQSIGLPIKDLDYIGMARPSREAIFAAYGIPSSKVGLSEGVNRSNSETNVDNYEESCLTPRLDQLEEGINIYLMPFVYGKDAAKYYFKYRSVITKDRRFELERALAMLTKSAVDVNGFLQLIGETRDLGEAGKFFLRDRSLIALKNPGDNPEPAPSPFGGMPGRETKPSDESEETETPEEGEESEGAEAAGKPAVKSRAAIRADKQRLELAELRFLRAQEKLETTLKGRIRALFSKEQAAILKAFRESKRAAKPVTRAWDEDALKALAGEWEEVLESFLLRGLKEGWALFEQEFDAAASFDVWNEEAKAWAEKFAGQHIKEIQKFTLDEVRRVIAAAVEQGAGTDKIVDAIRDLYDGFKGTRAEVIARTETAGAVNEGKYEAGAQTEEELGLRLKKTWIATEDERTRETHAEAHNQEVLYGEPFQVGDAELMFPGDQGGPPEEVINCLAGETKIVSPPVLRGYRRFYSGPVVTIKTALGHELTGTPNHPVLTRSGWITLDSLKEGDSIICCDLGQGMSFGDPNVERVPAEFHEVFNSLVHIGKVERIPGRNVDFHGDGKASEVDIVTTERELLNSIYAPDPEPVAEEDLSPSNLLKSDLFEPGAPGEFFLAALATSDGLVGRRDLGKAPLRVHPLPFEEFGLAPVSRLDFGQKQQSPDDITGSVELGSNGFLGHAREVCVSDSLSDIRPFASEGNTQGFRTAPNGDIVALENISDGVQAATDTVGDLPQIHSLPVKLDYIVSVVRSEFSGHVFNLETSNGWYIGNAIITHNCRCTFITDEIDED